MRQSEPRLSTDRTNKEAYDFIETINKETTRFEKKKKSYVNIVEKLCVIRDGEKEGKTIVV